MRKNLLMLLLVPAALCWLGCGAGDKVAGGGSDTPNAPAAFSGEVSIANGGGVSRSDVQAILFRVSADSTGQPFSTGTDTVFTDDSGAFTLESEYTGTHAVEFRKEGYTAFTGYLNVASTDEDTVINLDTVVLTRSLSVMGMFMYLDRADSIDIELVGTGSGVRIATSTTRVFVIKDVPLGNYNMRITLDPHKDTKSSMTLPLHTAVSDTVYNEIGFGQDTRVQIRNNIIEIDNDEVKLTCMVDEEQNVAGKAALLKAGEAIR